MNQTYIFLLSGCRRVYNKGMSSITLFPSSYDGRSVLQVDFMRMQHSGTVVGQTFDGEWIYIESDREGVPDEQRYWRVKATLIEALLQPQTP